MAKTKKVYTNALLGPFTFAHVHLSSPDTEGTYADNKYKVDGIGDPDGKAMAKAQSVLKEAIKACGLTPKGLNLPIKKETSKDKDTGKKSETGKLFIRSKSKQAPAIVDIKGNPIPAKALKGMKIGAGSEGLIEGYFTDYETTERVKDKETGEVEVVTIKGMSFTLTGIQLLKYVKGGGRGSNFGAYEGEGYEGGFTYEGGDDDEDGGLDLASDDGDEQDADDDEGGLDI
jgi:hypothetical protein